MMDRARNRMERAEASARVIKEYQPAYVLSLLRTRSYIASERPTPANRVIEGRLLRQRALYDSGKSFEFLLFEGALMWSMGSPSVMIEQLEHLRTVVDQQNISLGLVPAYSSLSVFIGHAFHIYDDKSVAVGTRSGTTYVSDVREVADYLALFDQLRDGAVFGGDAVAVIERSLIRYRDLL